MSKTKKRLQSMIASAASLLARNVAIVLVEAVVALPLQEAMATLIGKYAMCTLKHI